MKKLLIINGSPQGRKGNCARFIERIKKTQKMFQYEVIHLSQTGAVAKALNKIKSSDGVLFVSGTYWDSWGHPLQHLLQEMNQLEAIPEVMGKPAGVLVLMHSVGGKEVVSRLQGVLCTMGFLIPPMSGMAYSLVSDLLFKTKKTGSHAKDFWHKDDIELVLLNLKTAMEVEIKWNVWPVDKKDARRVWF